MATGANAPTDVDYSGPVQGSQPSSGALHERAAESARETRQAIIAMASASLGFFVVAITNKETPVLPLFQWLALITSLVLMAAATSAGLFSAWADARWSFCWARQLESRFDEADKKKWSSMRCFWHSQKRWSENVAMISFGFGVLAAAVYVLMRASGA